MDVRYFSRNPAIGNTLQLQLYHLLGLFSEMPENRLTSSVVLEGKKQRVWAIEEPHLYADVLE